MIGGEIVSSNLWKVKETRSSSSMVNLYNNPNFLFFFSISFYPFYPIWFLNLCSL
jgi:hypothetical protein